VSVHVELVSPERLLYSGDADVVVCRTTEGDIAFLPGHAPFVGALGIGIVRIIHESGEDVAAIHGGFVEVTGDRVIILSEVAEMAADIDVERARNARERAEVRMAEQPSAEAEAAIERAHTRLVAAGVADSIKT
jgi:F-type H+-transporting ATPase subunit epsilon